VESLSALVEEPSGQLRLVDWHEIMLRWEQAQMRDDIEEADLQPA
jgi:hypothetical protein